MTNEYKYNLLKYLTNKIDSETGINEPQFSDYIITDKNIRKQIADSLGYEDIAILGCINPSNEGNFLVYGNLLDQKSYIAIFNSKMELITTLTKFDSGADIFKIYCMKQDTDGYIYAVSQVVNDNVITMRVLLLNNILASGLSNGDYYVTIRKSYVVPDNTISISDLSPSRDVIIKAPDEATYYITGRYSSTTNTTVVIKFKIDVSSGNTWDYYSLSVRTVNTRYSVILNKTDNGYNYYLYSLDVVASNYTETEIDYDGNITTLKTISLSNIGILDNLVLAVSSDEIYISADNDSTHIASLYKVDGNSLKILDQTSSYVGQYYYSGFYNLQNINGNVFFTKYSPSSTGVDINFGMIIDDTIYFNETTTPTTIRYNLENYGITTSYNETFINNTFNLFNIYIDSDYNNDIEGNYNNKIQLVYNSNNYNGKSFNDKNSLNPSTAQLYNEDEQIIFARNLYNKVVQNNTTEATVEVPNTYLNDQNIAVQDLLSVNNNIMVQNNNLISKNVYESLIINFFNTLRMVNNNNEIPIYNSTGASRLNNSISNLIDYEDATLTKARINYEDGTSEVLEISYNTVTNARKINLTITISKEITNIEFISDDEETTYNTITGNFEIGKTYKIEQLVTVEGLEIILENVQYNGENIQYNGEDIVYIGE